MSCADLTFYVKMFNTSWAVTLAKLVKWNNPITCATGPTDQQKALKHDYLQDQYIVLEKRGFRHLFTFTLKALTITDVPAQLAHSASIF